jgi:hypothetical protein
MRARERPRLGVAVVAVGLLVGGFVLLTGKDEPPTANAADAVAVVGEPTSAQPPLMQPHSNQPVPAPVSHGAPNEWQIVYELSGAGTATVVYDENGFGLLHQELAVTLPWRKELTWRDSGAAPSVQLLGQGDGQVECKVSVRGAVVVSQKTPSGEVATCAGKLG